MAPCEHQLINDQMLLKLYNTCSGISGQFERADRTKYQFLMMKRAELF
jgi:hypothetical protein